MAGVVEGFPAVADAIARWVEIAGVAVIVTGAVFSTLLFVAGYRPHRDFNTHYHRYRAHLGRSILLGLELLVAGDIIGTVAIEPTLRSLAVLAGIVLIRTFLSLSLELEINGHWPWDARKYKEREQKEL